MYLYLMNVLAEYQIRKMRFLFTKWQDFKLVHIICRWQIEGYPNDENCFIKD